MHDKITKINMKLSSIYISYNYKQESIFLNRYSISIKLYNYLSTTNYYSPTAGCKKFRI